MYQKLTNLIVPIVFMDLWVDYYCLQGLNIVESSFGECLYIQERADLDLQIRETSVAFFIDYEKNSNEYTTYIQA